MAPDALDRLRESHLNIARRSAKYLEDVAAGMRVSLETGHIPARRKIICSCPGAMAKPGAKGHVTTRCVQCEASGIETVFHDPPHEPVTS